MSALAIAGFAILAVLYFTGPRNPRPYKPKLVRGHDNSQQEDQKRAAGRVRREPDFFVAGAGKQE
jgi:hypothetical protein